MFLKFFLYAALIVTSIPWGESSFPCRLEWVPVRANSSIREGWVRVDSDKEISLKSQYIARVENENFKDGDYKNGIDFILAMMKPSLKGSERKDQAGVISDEDIFELSLKDLVNSTTLNIYEVLTNPHNCTLTWESCIFETDPLSMISRRYSRVSSSNVTGNEYIARVQAYNIRNAARTKSGITGMVKNYQSKEYQISNKACLQSTTTAELRVTQFVFDYKGAQPNTEDMIGFDEITNGADATVIQTIKHTKIFPEKHSFQQFNQNWNLISPTLFHPFFSCNFLDSSVKLNASHLIYSSSDDHLVFSLNKTITSSRVMNVLPRSSIQACSIVTLSDNYVLTYRAEGRFKRSPGMDKDDISSTLQAANYTGYRYERDSYVLEMKGTYEGKMGFRTSFYVTSTDDEITCKTMNEKYERRNVLKDRVDFDASAINMASLKEADVEIQSMKRKLTARRRREAKPST